MKTPKFIQANCFEGNEIDLRQANVVLKYKPDIILFESPQGKLSPNTIFNKYSSNNKPLKKVDDIIKNLKISSKKYPYAKSDIAVWKNIKSLWENDKNVHIYNIDGPDELRRKCIFEYPKARKDSMFWAYLLVRELYMTKNIQWILNKYPKKENLKITVFLQSIHWKHVKFLLKSPSKQKIWEYYFGRFKDTTLKGLRRKIKTENKILYKYWNKISSFK